MGHQLAQRDGHLGIIGISHLIAQHVAQLVIQPISLCTPVEVEELDETNRGVGGFGSSGQK